MRSLSAGRERGVLTKHPPSPQRYQSHKPGLLPSVRISLATDITDVGLLEDTLRELALYSEAQGDKNVEGKEREAEKKEEWKEESSAGNE